MRTGPCSNRLQGATRALHKTEFYCAAKTLTGGSKINKKRRTSRWRPEKIFPLLSPNIPARLLFKPGSWMCAYFYFLWGTSFVCVPAIRFASCSTQTKWGRISKTFRIAHRRFVMRYFRMRNVLLFFCCKFEWMGLFGFRAPAQPWAYILLIDFCIEFYCANTSKAAD